MEKTFAEKVSSESFAQIKSKGQAVLDQFDVPRTKESDKTLETITRHLIIGTQPKMEVIYDRLELELQQQGVDKAKSEKISIKAIKDMKEALDQQKSNSVQQHKR